MEAASITQALIVSSSEVQNALQNRNSTEFRFFCRNFRNWRTETEEGSSGELWLEFRRFSLLSERLRSIDLH